MERQKTRIANIRLKKQNKLRRLTPSDFSTYKATVSVKYGTRKIIDK